MIVATRAEQYVTFAVPRMMRCNDPRFERIGLIYSKNTLHSGHITATGAPTHKARTMA